MKKDKFDAEVFETNEAGDGKGGKGFTVSGLLIGCLFSRIFEICRTRKLREEFIYA